MSISRLTVSWLAGAKVADISIHSKHICLFFETFLKQFRKWLIDKDVLEHKFERENERSWKGVHYYICVRVWEGRLTHLPPPPPTGYSSSREEEKGPPIRIIKGIIGKQDSEEEVLAEL